MPFASVRIEDGKNKNSTQIRPCCSFTPDNKMAFDNLEEYFKSDMLHDLQQHLLTQDTLPSACKVCQTVEDSGQLSVRQLKNKFFDIDVLSETAIQELDVFPSNVCNLSCIMCSPKFSSAIAAEQKKIGSILEVNNFDETDRICDAIDALPDLKYITVAGGEFFYAKHCTRLLKQIQKNKVINLKITTNGTVFDLEHIEILKQIPKLELRFSIDGTHDRYEFIRYPAKWNEVQKNIARFQQELPDAEFEIVIVMQPLNIFSVFDWLKFANNNDLKTHWINILGSDVSWAMLTQPEKNSVSEFIQQGIKHNKLTVHQKLSLLNHSKNTIHRICFDPIVRSQSIEKIVRLSNHRKIPLHTLQSIAKDFPDLYQEIINYENSHHSHP